MRISVDCPPRMGAGIREDEIRMAIRHLLCPPPENFSLPLEDILNYLLP